MSLTAKKKPGSDIQPLEGGTYCAVCVGVIDIGEQKNEKFGNYSNKMIFIFEIPDEKVEIDGEMKPRWLSQEYTVSLSDKSNLTRALTSWRGKPLSAEETKNGFDLSNMLNTGCQLQVIVEQKEDRAYNKITAIIGLPKGVEKPDPINDLLLYDMDSPNKAVFDKLPEWIRNRIEKSSQYKANAETKTLDFEEPDIDADIPF